MLAALQRVQEDLGPEALIISVRQVPAGPAWQVWRKPMVEVVATQFDKNEAKGENQLAGLPKVDFEEGKNAPTQTAGGHHVRPYVFPTVNKRDINREIDGEQSPTGGNLTSAPPLEKIVTPSRETISVNTDDTWTETVAIPGKTPLSPAMPAIKRQEKQLSQEELIPFLSELMKRNQERVVEAPSLKEVEIAEPIPEKESPALVGEVEKTEIVEFPPVLDEAIAHLKNAEVDVELLQKIGTLCVQTLPPRSMRDEDKVRDYLLQQLSACVRIQKVLVGLRPQIITLIGTSGAGKTSTCAKLAVHYSINARKKVSWVSADTVRTGAISEARTYAETIGIPFRYAYTPEELAEAVDAEENADIILVDTPACNPRSESSIVELGSLLTVLPWRNTWIVAPVTSREVDLRNALAAFAPFRANGLVLTKMDETNSFGVGFNLAFNSQIPLTFFTNGTRVINDLVPARAELLCRALFNERFVA